MSIIYVPEESYRNAVELQPEPTLVVIYAPGYGAGKVMHPTLEALARTARGRYNVVKYRVDDEYDPFAVKHRVRKFPHYLLINRGEVLEEFSGISTYERLLEVVNRYAK